MITKAVAFLLSELNTKNNHFVFCQEWIYWFHFCLVISVKKMITLHWLWFVNFTFGKGFGEINGKHLNMKAVRIENTYHTE